MRFALFIIAGLAGLATASSKAANVFKKAERAVPVIERNDGHGFQNPRLQKRASRYLTNATEKFLVNGTGVPEVRFDIGESYAGLLPISGSSNETRELFFWFFSFVESGCKRRDCSLVQWWSGMQLSHWPLGRERVRWLPCRYAFSAKVLQAIPLAGWDCISNSEPVLLDKPHEHGLG